ncbi:hypothetical protein EJB05_21697 [Eragrostis curvula]|uniref:Uncharacterized protein n=1 Tax=Eragrostis curvula TaxID=38414 RepID=A0A5J9V3Y7_9POAL|nr:hypothetical protein EJB05_21697 [Eragrostis curvula]
MANLYGSSHTSCDEQHEFVSTSVAFAERQLATCIHMWKLAKSGGAIVSRQFSDELIGFQHFQLPQ